jgi:protein TonB
VKVESGPPLLRNAAIMAVKKWIYRPTILNGKPIEAETRISLNFVSRR